jgi:hypothetical protein
VSSDSATAASADADGLASALERVGIPCEVESRGRLALLAAAAAVADRLVTADRRREVVALAKAHGFTNVALELVDARPLARAPVLRD